MRRRLILFDIDGTLLLCGPEVRSLFAATLVEVFGTAGEIDTYNFAGRVDPQIVLDLMTAAGLPAREVETRLPRMRELYLARLENALDHRRMRLLPGVLPLLEGLAGGPGVTLALLTGNWEPGARSKLSRFDLNRFFSFGAFGCDAVHRSALPPVALERAARFLGGPIDPGDALVVGDSLHDISCARDNGIPVLAVATGRTPASQLRAASPDWLAADLEEALATLPWLAALAG